MYLLIIIATLFVLPVACILFEMTVVSGDAGLMVLVGKWFVFWAGGIRLLLAGMMQIFKPEYTAQKIFDIKDREAFKIVAELGFGNVSIGTICALSILFPAWVTPAALASGLFYGLAGGQHVLNQGRSQKENVALISDLGISAVLALFLVWTALQG